VEDHIEALIAAKEKMREVASETYPNQMKLNDVVHYLTEGIAEEKGWKLCSQNHRAWLKTNGYFKNNASDYIIAVFAGDLPKKLGRLSANSELVSKMRVVRVTKMPTSKGIIYLATGLFNSVNMCFTSHFFDRYKERCMKNLGTRTDAIRHFFIREYFTGMCGIEDNQKYYDVKHTKAVYKNGLGMGVGYEKTTMIKTYVSNSELNERNIDFHKEISEYRERYEKLYQDSCRERVTPVFEDHKTVAIDKDSLSIKKHILGGTKNDKATCIIE
jgi:hypothetical protein